MREGTNCITAGFCLPQWMIFQEFQNMKTKLNYEIGGDFQWTKL
ncbi:hypothetical protein PAV_4c03200 [Paenibacillus alvei DSM 29]|nr:hypothetical protein PAV_4c03200 [Paenibacillus alvei DSM 29]